MILNGFEFDEYFLTKPMKRPIKQKKSKNVDLKKEKEIGGPSGPEPTRYGDWEKKGICYDF